MLGLVGDREPEVRLVQVRQPVVLHEPGQALGLGLDRVVVDVVELEVTVRGGFLIEPGAALAEVY